MYKHDSIDNISTPLFQMILSEGERREQGKKVITFQPILSLSFMLKYEKKN